MFQFDLSDLVSQVVLELFASDHLEGLGWLLRVWVQGFAEVEFELDVAHLIVEFSEVVVLHLNLVEHRL
jgi:hypothetical protein